MIRTLIALPYELARLPFVMIDNRLAARTADDAGSRLALDHVIGSADKFAGTVLRDRGIAQRGADRLERSETLAKAAQLDEEAAARREQASKQAAAGRRQATQKRKAAQERAAKGLDEADAAEARGKREAKAKATKAANARKAAADKKAATATATAEQRKSNVDVCRRGQEEGRAAQGEGRARRRP